MILESPNLLFRPLELADLDAFCALEADPEVRRYIGGAPRPREIAEERFLRALARAAEPLSLRATLLKPESHFIGVCGLYPAHHPNEAMLSFKLARQWWNQGFATEAGRVFLAHGFGRLHLSRIRAVIQVGNHASARVLEKLGFIRTHREEGLRSFDHFEQNSASHNNIPIHPIP